MPRDSRQAPGARRLARKTLASIQPQDRCVVGEDGAPVFFSFGVTTSGPSVEENHLAVCTELQRPWQEDMEYMEVLRVQHNNQRAEQY